MSFYLSEPISATRQPGNNIDWEETGCLLCGGSNWTPLAEAPDRARGSRGLWFMVVQCQECGLCFTNPRPSEGVIGSFYPPDYAPHQVADKTHRPHWWRRLPPLAGRHDTLRKVLPLHGEGRLLDFGCGGGSFLVRMRRQGWKVTGLDLSDRVAARLRNDHGLAVFTGSLPHPLLEDARFDVITMWQSLEHVHRPLEVLHAARHLLTPEGKLIIAVPNIDSLAFRWFGSAWNGLDLPRHLVHFAPATLRLMLRRAGLEAGPIAMVRRSGWLRSSARFARRRLPQQPRWLRWLQKKGMSTLASWFGYWTGQADCMLVTATRA